MNIRLKLNLQFALIAAGILLLVSFIIYSLSEQHRQQEFYFRLETRALTTARLLITVKEIDKNLLDIIEKNTAQSLFKEQIEIYNANNELIYDLNQRKDSLPSFPSYMIAVARQNGMLKTKLAQNDCLGLLYEDRELGQFVVLITAEDRYGQEQLRDLSKVLIQGFFLGLIVIVLTGMIFSRRVLAPIAKMNETMELITAGSLNQRIPIANEKDELGVLARNFNQMLTRLEAAFDVQRQFVSNASHELRTPLMALTSQIQLTLNKVRTQEEYQATLLSLYEDTQKLIALSNGLLLLAQTNLQKQKRQFAKIRIDELILDAQNDLVKARPNYRFSIEYDQVPEDEAFLNVEGNALLLRIAFVNLMENGCKFSANQSVKIAIAPKTDSIKLSFIDEGIGIPYAEQAFIFRPFYRATNVQTKTQGNGIGLSLSFHIIELHDGTLTVQSSPNQGSIFEVELPVSTA